MYYYLIVSCDLLFICFLHVLFSGDIRFPKKFPNGVLLGCVTVSDCLAQEDYREKYPDGESDEPFVFICEDPIICPIMFPLKGQHKICKYIRTIDLHTVIS